MKSEPEDSYGHDRLRALLGALTLFGGGRLCNLSRQDTERALGRSAGTDLHKDLKAVLAVADRRAQAARLSQADVVILERIVDRHGELIGLKDAA